MGVKDDTESHCLLCHKKAISKCCVSIRGGERTIAEVLLKLFKKEKVSTKISEKDLAKELLCSECKTLVEEMYSLQHQLKQKKDKIVNMFCESQKTMNGNGYLDELVSKKLNSKRKKVKSSHKKNKVSKLKEDVYIIDLLKEKKGDKFLVKWENFSSDEDTWEPESSIPEYIVQVALSFSIIMNKNKFILNFIQF